MENKNVNKELIHKVHEHIEGRYELDSFDYGVIQSLLCDLQKFHSLNSKLNELRPTKQVVEKMGATHCYGYVDCLNEVLTIINTL